MSRTCPQNVPVMTILGHPQKCPESICPMSFFYFSNLSHVLAQNCLKMCPRPGMSQTRPGRVPDVPSKFPCPDYFRTSTNRTSATKMRISRDRGKDRQPKLANQVSLHLTKQSNPPIIHMKPDQRRLSDGSPFYEWEIVGPRIPKLNRLLKTL